MAGLAVPQATDHGSRPNPGPIMVERPTRHHFGSRMVLWRAIRPAAFPSAQVSQCVRLGDLASNDPAERARAKRRIILYVQYCVRGGHSLVSVLNVAVEAEKGATGDAS